MPALCFRCAKFLKQAFTFAWPSAAYLYGCDWHADPSHPHLLRCDQWIRKSRCRTVHFITHCPPMEGSVSYVFLLHMGYAASSEGHTMLCIHTTESVSARSTVRAYIMQCVFLFSSLVSHFAAAFQGEDMMQLRQPCRQLRLYQLQHSAKNSR